VNSGRRRRGFDARRLTLRTPAGGPGDLDADRAEALALTNVSRETLDRLDRFVATLLTWQQRTNLIAPSTEPTIWTRHIADSLQLIPLAPEAQTSQPQTWVDLGSGGGFPGLVIACALADQPGARVHLIESNTKKAAFLREAARAAGAPAEVHAVRIEDFVENFSAPVDVVTARALAPLADLLAAAYPLLKTGAVGLFPKGQDVGSELTQAAKCWTIQSSLVQSLTDPKGQIVRVTGINPEAQP
jgi:16S rRNA (guanine527-N7)-methyltransferase